MNKASAIDHKEIFIVRLVEMGPNWINLRNDWLLCDKDYCSTGWVEKLCTLGYGYTFRFAQGVCYNKERSSL